MEDLYGFILFERIQFICISDSDSDHMLETQLGQRIYTTCDMKQSLRALLQGGALASRDVMRSTVPKIMC